MEEVISIGVLVLILFVLGIIQMQAQKEQATMEMGAETIQKARENLKIQKSKKNQETLSIMSKVKKVNKKIEKVVVDGYNAFENGVVAGYKAVEDGVVGGYKKIEGKFVKAFLTPEEELVQE